MDAGCIDKPVVDACKVSSHKNSEFAVVAVDWEVTQFLGRVNHWRNNVLRGMDDVLREEV